MRWSRCPKCERPVRESAVFCLDCGAVLSDEAGDIEAEQITVDLGAHRFPEDRPNRTSEACPFPRAEDISSAYGESRAAGSLRLKMGEGSMFKSVIESGCSFVIGRSTDSDLVVADETASRRHAEIYVSEGKWMIRDLASTNGTFVNGVEITESVLEEGDTVRVGETDILIGRCQSDAPESDQCLEPSYGGR
ncbi:MAG: FHA domain-containing protein [Candidatus Aquicultorales bacterium]